MPITAVTTTRYVHVSIGASCAALGDSVQLVHDGIVAPFDVVSRFCVAVGGSLFLLCIRHAPFRIAWYGSNTCSLEEYRASETKEL
jgi:hypothetical protein